MRDRGTAPVWHNGYPHADGRPMAESDTHRDLMCGLIDTLESWFADHRYVYVSGNLMVFFERGDKRRWVAPDVFVVRGVPNHDRPNFLLWEERRGPEFVIEVTSSSTRRIDTEQKFRLYRDTLKVRDYFLFDPFEDHLDPPLRGYRLRGGEYVNIRPMGGRLPSLVTGLHLERDGESLRLYDPATQTRLLTAQARERKAMNEIRRLRAELRKLRREE